jgi:crotonobetainyl-CoA:carnitine CoA-transferase CaiB-like acyl-CoA transferase
MLSLVPRPGEKPTNPPTLIADIGAGAYPAVINILLGLQARRAGGTGCHIDVSMNDYVLPFLYWAVGDGLGLGRWQRPGGEQITGGSPRYNIYRTSDDRYIATAPLEQKFWVNFCDVIALPPALRDDKKDPAATFEGVAHAVRQHSAEHWRRAFERVDACVSVVATMEEALDDPHYRSRGVFAHHVMADGRRMPAAPVPVDGIFRAAPEASGYPELGEANGLLAGNDK